MGTDTNAPTDSPEVIEPELVGNPLAALGLGGLDLGAMMAGLGIELPDADAPDLDDVLDELAELRACVDYIARALIATADAVPAKFRPDLGPYPPPVEV